MKLEILEESYASKGLIKAWTDDSKKAVFNAMEKYANQRVIEELEYIDKLETFVGVKHYIKNKLKELKQE